MHPCNVEYCVSSRCDPVDSNIIADFVSVDSADAEVVVVSVEDAVRRLAVLLKFQLVARRVQLPPPYSRY